MIHVQFLQLQRIKKQTRFADETFDMMIGNIIDDKAIQDQAGYEKYDIVTANILADVTDSSDTGHLYTR